MHIERSKLPGGIKPFSGANKIALGGGCHWCTEAVFQSLKGIIKVEQGYVASTGLNSELSEAVIVHFDSKAIELHTLIAIHLHTHKSTSDHSFRSKYRSAIYTFSETQEHESKLILKKLQTDFKKTLITQVLPFSSFKASRNSLLNYYYSNPEKPFCEIYINPKLALLKKQFSEYFTNKDLLQVKSD
ncbi:peptide-methionine (S)-S-oxide reductase [Leeuwenhoekiella marinoflava]|uniref:peptide-methionine (S)-S-oxide reductase n=2 Tax=Leeuwenhoekiella marinoflava TaxID=988 RepID=A0A4Q0P2U3_9FLAO|nr:peptide-methionine (S)-S-oxide reductase [Leeuwenhoekiella marinoflava]RXG20883.1 peptide-methionine (S)-S-oxide reductase [Leeuwenhoekiella marinoflava]SHG06341.1 peptide-methionine (S)-S-oxide reductase [Leeuwenhoekiella marinoflava DSM 3653]